MTPRVYFIGAGPSYPGWMAKEAWDILQRVDVALVVGEALRTGDWPWAARMERTDSAGALERLKHWAGRQQDVAVLVPESPSHHPLMAKWVRWAREEVQLGGIVPGIWSVTAAMDVDGFCIAEPVAVSAGVPPAIYIEGPGKPDPRVRWVLGAEGRWTEGEEAAGNGRMTVDAPPLLPHFWFSSRPLSGHKVVFLRAGSAAERPQSRLRAYGAEVYTAPVSQIADPLSWDAVDEALSHLDRYEWVIFTSQEAVTRFFQSLRRVGIDIRRLRAQVAVVGPQTAAAVQDFGVYPTVMPDQEYSQEGLAERFASFPVLGQGILLPGGNLNRSYLEDFLAQQGALITKVQMYRNQPLPLAPPVAELFAQRAVGAVFYTASSAVEHLMEQNPDLRPAIRDTVAVSIGPLTSRTLTHYGIPVSAEADRPSMDAMVDELLHFMMKKFSRGDA